MAEEIKRVRKTPAKKSTKTIDASPEVKATAVAVQTLTRAERIIKFIHKYIVVPEGMLIGQNMNLLAEQQEFIRAVYDNLDEYGKLITRTGIFSIARKNGKSGLISSILGAHIFGPEQKTNAQLYSAARSRDQAALVFNYLAKSIRLRKDLVNLVNITDSGKKIQGLRSGSLYQALSADATTAHGKSPALSIHDELGQVIGPTDALFDALETAGGGVEEPLSLVISTQAASDTDLLSILIDDALRNPTPETIVRLYAADPEADIFKEETWYKSNFALGIFRSLKDMRDFAGKAKRMPSQEAAFRNLYLNQRISRLSLLVPPSLWKQCNSIPNIELFYKHKVAIGLDLSATTDLTAAVLSCQDPDTGIVHQITYVFTPKDTLLDRAKTDRAPYHVWADKGQIIAVPGKHISYDMVCEFLALATEGMNINIMAFDRWRIKEFKQACERAGFAQNPLIKWSPVGQGYRDMEPRVARYEEMLLTEGLAHGSHPALNMAAANAVVEMDPARNRKPDKSKSSARIDPLVASLMSMYACLVDEEEPEAPKKPVDEKSMFFV
jgi:phage terminase large subunit-like protein